MSSAATAAPPDPAIADAPVESAWAIPWRQFKKKKLAVLSLWLVGFLFFVAIFAPLLANDLPIYVKAALPQRYESAFWAYDDGQRVLKGLLSAEERDEEKLARVAENMLSRLDDAAGLLPDDGEVKLRAAGAEYGRRIAAARAGTRLDAAGWDALREGLEPWSPDGDVKVAARAFWPILRGLHPDEIFFVALFVAVLGFPLYARAIDAYGRRRLIDPFNLVFLKAAALFAIPTAVALAVPALVPRKDDADRAAYKKLAAAAKKRGDEEAVFVFPLVPYGENENILEDQKKKPTWLLSEEERIAQVLPDLFKRRDEQREARARAELPELVLERDEAIAALDRDARETMKKNIFARAWRSLSPPEEVRALRARKAEIAAKLAEAFAGAATDLDQEIAAEYQRRKGELRWHWIGTDTNGRDVLARMVYGARVSMSVGFVAEGIAVTIGVILGALAGYFRGWVDIALSRIIEVVICFPVFFFILTILAFLPQSIINIMIVIGITGWPGIARLMRAEFLRLGNLDFVTAGRALGLSDARIIFRHVMPNGLAPILVSTTFGIAGAILVESALSFLGFGVPQPTASWGDTLNNGGNDPQGTWWLTVFPGTALFLTVTAYNLVGDAFRDATDPRLRQ